jgi:hypothetical protein
MGPSNFCQNDISLQNSAVLLNFDLYSKLSSLYRVARSQYLNTEEFIDAVAEELRARLSTRAKL